MFGFSLQKILICVVSLHLAACNWFGDEEGAPAAPASTSDSGTTTGLGTVTTLKITASTASPKNNTCVGITLSGFNAAGTNVASDTEISITLADTTANNRTGLFYSNSTCTTALASNITSLTEGASSVTVYYKTNHAATVTLSAVPSGTTGEVTVENLTAAFGSSATALYLNVDADPPPGGVYSSNNCYGPFYITAVDSNVNEIIVNSEAATSVSISYLLGDGKLYGPTDTNCSGAVVNTSAIPAGSKKTQALYFKGTQSTIVDFTHAGLNVTSGHSFDF